MQTPDQRQAADARLAPFAGIGGWRIAVFGAAVTVGFVSAILASAVILTSNPEVLALSVDFRVFWAAAKLALQGDALAVHDTVRLAAVHATNVEDWMPWLYPPGYLVLITPLGALHFAPAFILWTVLSAALIALALRPFVGGIPQVWLAVSLAPAFIPTLMLGQNNLLWMAGLLAALAALRSGRMVLAGVLIGCLTLKPQLGLMIPFALLAAGAWRTILAATLTTIVITAIPTWIYGLAYWPLLLETLNEQGSRMMFSLNDLYLMVSPLFLLVLLGVNPDLALMGQWVITAICALSVLLMWRSTRIGFDAKVAGLLVAMLLSAPYLWYYEAAITAVLGLFLLRSGILGTRPLDLVLLFLLWIGGALQALNTFAEVANQRWLGAGLITPILVISLALCLLHLARARPDPAQDTRPRS